MTAVEIMLILFLSFDVTYGLQFDVTITDYFEDQKLYCGKLNCVVDLVKNAEIKSLVNMSVYSINEHLQKNTLAFLSVSGSKFETVKSSGARVEQGISSTQGNITVSVYEDKICRSPKIICDVYYISHVGQITKIEKTRTQDVHQLGNSLMMIYVKSKTPDIVKAIESFMCKSYGQDECEKADDKVGCSMDLNLMTNYFCNEKRNLPPVDVTKTALFLKLSSFFEEKLQNLTEELHEKLEDIETRLTFQKEECAKFKSEFLERNEKIAKLINDVETKAFANLSTGISKVYTTLNNSISLNKNNISRVDQSLEAINRSVQGLKERIVSSNVDTKIASVERNLKANQENINNVSGQLRVTEKQISELKEAKDKDDYLRTLETYECRRGNRTSKIPGRIVVRLDNGHKVLCDTETDGGGWIVIQRRMNGKLNFLRSWDEYKNGFGDLSDEFWIGNSIIHLLTVQGYRVLRFDLKYRGLSYFAEYRNLYVKSEEYKYKINFSGFRGTAPDHFHHHENQWFSTVDRDNDNSNSDCANKRKAGWWFNDCQWVNLNALWVSQGEYTGVYWHGITEPNESLDYVEMKVRRE